MNEGLRNCLNKISKWSQKSENMRISYLTKVNILLFRALTKPAKSQDQDIWVWTNKTWEDLVAEGKLNSVAEWIRVKKCSQGEEVLHADRKLQQENIKLQGRSC